MIDKRVLSFEDVLATARYGIDHHEKTHGIKLNDELLLIKMQEELGEIAEAFLILREQVPSRKKTEAAKAKENLSKEFADLLGMTLALSQRMGIDLEAAWQEKWGKVKR